jgi:hypothetical protein
LYSFYIYLFSLYARAREPFTAGVTFIERSALSPFYLIHLLLTAICSVALLS